MGAHAVRMNINKPFVNGGISAPIKSVQPRWSYSHEAVHPPRLHNFYYLPGGFLEVLA